jgi:hypothetical protein
MILTLTDSILVNNSTILDFGLNYSISNIMTRGYDEKIKSGPRQLKGCPWPI